MRAAVAGVLVRAHAVHRRGARAPDRGRGDLRTRRVGADLPNAGRGDREGELDALRPGRRPPGRRHLAEHVQQVRPERRLRRLQGERFRARGRPCRPPRLRPHRAMTDRLPIRKTYKLFIGGAFVRSESGRYDRIEGGSGAAAAAAVNIPRGSRKDVRDAVAAARKSSTDWAERTAYNRGQILYRFAEALESRRADIGAPADEVGEAVDVLVHYAGWTDKLQPVLGGINPVAAPYLSFSVPEPTGVVGLIAPDEPELLGLVAELAPALAAANTLVAVLSETGPLPGLDLGEVLGIADVPGGVVNLLAGRRVGHPRAPRRSHWLVRRGHRRPAEPPRGRDRAQDGLAPGRRVARLDRTIP